MKSESEVSQSYPTLCDPMDTRLLRPWDFLGKSTGVMLAQGSPVFHSSFEGELGIALESLQEKRDLI